MPFSFTPRNPPPHGSHSSSSMAIVAVTGGCVRLSLPKMYDSRRRIATFSAISSSENCPVDQIVESSSFFEKDSRPIMLYDGVCNLCNGGVRFFMDNDRNRKIRYEALQSKGGKKLLVRSGRAPDDISSVVLVEKDRSYIKSEAVLRIMQHISIPFPQLALFFQLVPLFIRDFVYDNIADNRYGLFGRSESCEIYND